MKRLYIPAMLILLCAVHVIPRLQAQTPGTLTFSVTTTEPVGNYNNVNVIALWIEDTNGNFVKTKIRYAATRIQYLNVWIASSSYNTVDAVTGPTRATHGTLTFNWNATDVSGNVVSDGDYRVWIQMSDKNAAGATTSVTFTKDTSSVTLNPANDGNFTNMSLQWNPTIGIREEAGKNLHFECTPNPVSGPATIGYVLDEPGDVTIVLRDLQGRSVRVLLDENQSAGAHRMMWTGADDSSLPSGMYFLTIETGKATAGTKVVVAR